MQFVCSHGGLNSRRNKKIFQSFMSSQTRSHSRQPFTKLMKQLNQKKQQSSLGITIFGWEVRLGCPDVMPTVVVSVTFISGCLRPRHLIHAPSECNVEQLGSFWIHLDFFQHLNFGVCAPWNSGGRQESSTATAVGSDS